MVSLVKEKHYSIYSSERDFTAVKFCSFHSDHFFAGTHTCDICGHEIPHLLLTGDEGIYRGLLAEIQTMAEME